MQPDHANCVVLGETVEGIAAAVRAARQGVDTLLVTYKHHLGGVFPSLGAIETHYAGARNPFVEELKQRIVEYYRSRFGEASPEYRVCTNLDKHSPFITFEPHIAELILNEMVTNQPRLRVLKRHYPVSVELACDELRAVILESFDDASVQRVYADAFIDATYEGDLAAIAGVRYRVGREARSEYGELHAGRLFTQIVTGVFPHDATTGKLNLLPKKWTTQGILSGSTGEGDNNIQSYSYRLCVSNDPANRRLPDQPAGYNREHYLALVEDVATKATKHYTLHHRFLVNALRDMIAQDHIFHGHELPNHKRSWNATNFTGAGKHYPDANWQTRDKIAQQHIQHALGLMYFMQNDPALPEDIRASACEWGLARDEFMDTQNIPEQMYIREARRIRGRFTFTEHDAKLAAGIERAPIHPDSIAVTEFPLDSLACTPERMPSSLCDGQFFQAEASRPGQIPFGVMLPERINNLLVPVAASASHVAWGTIRQSVTLMQLAEVAGFAVGLAHLTHTPPGKLDCALLQQTLVESQVMITFFNEFDMSTPAEWVPAVQYLGTKGFFAGYAARPDQFLALQTAQVWAQIARELWLGHLIDATAWARQGHLNSDDTLATWADLITCLQKEIEYYQIESVDLFGAIRDFKMNLDDHVSRAHACQFIYTLIWPGKNAK